MQLNIKKLKSIIKEELDEYTAYHGSQFDFDKFNHKKYLGKGTGFQTYGWGTYVTDDLSNAKSYATDDDGNYHILYEVEIPDDNGMNYIDWYYEMTDEQIDNIITCLKKIYSKHKTNIKLKRALSYVANDGKNERYGSMIYDGLEMYLNSPKAASLILAQCGFIGIKYHCGRKTTNFVIFDANNVKIKKKTNIE